MRVSSNELFSTLKDIYDVDLHAFQRTSEPK